MPITLIFFLLLSADVTGWSKAHWGMTDAQVLEAFGGEATLQTGPVRDRDFLDAGIAAVAVDSVQIGRTAYRAFFLNDRKASTLRSVQLQPRHKESVTDVEFLNLEALLAQKYGRPLHRDSTDRKISQWTLPATVITLTFTTIKEVGFHSLWLTYEQRDAKLEDNL